MSVKFRPQPSPDIIGNHYHQNSFHTVANDLGCSRALKHKLINNNEGPRGMLMQGYTYSQPQQHEEVGWLVPTLGRPYPRYTFYRTPKSVWTRSSDEKTLSLRCPGSKPEHVKIHVKTLRLKR